MKYVRTALSSLILAGLLTGCMYPQDELSQNRVPYEEQITSVQTAVNQFQESNGGILPIKTKEGDTPIYQKYPIDFPKIVPQYLAEPPGNAFEAGGIFQYVLIDVETSPKVKLFDLRIAESIRDIRMRIRAGGYPPYKERIGENIYTLDFTELGYKEPPFAVSPYTNHNLPFVVSGTGEIYVDYRSDLFQLLDDTSHQLNPGEDIRPLLVEDSMFVPAYSLPYTIDPKTKEPIFLEK
ncbi:hypothetical protein [Mesobacillus harenae]|uniref:hypothetical protein n=1 Tax=Mesobacillus harenae TaxID=2213203 RepID=UPI00157FC9E3|nr:hypothetical protein [Mesobacillus harenae]